jgi:alpha-L-fucosidase
MKLPLIALLLAFTPIQLHAEISTNPATAATRVTDKVETKEQRDARMAWWRDAKFGLFIHWGVYCVPAGSYHDKPQAKRLGEWIMSDEKIPIAEYQQFAKEFNPVKFDADAWVKAAKEAGMKYIVITAKHHEGFAMFETKASPWNIVEAAPYGKDVLKPLAEACRKEGIKLGFYYSQAQDWNNGGAEASGVWDKAQEHDMDDYIDKIAVPQVKELLTNYGEFPVVLWWDTPKNMTEERAAKIYKEVKELKPGIIMNNRLGGGFQGDYMTPENKIPPQGYPGNDWETCMTMNNTWGFRRDDNNWKPTETILRNLCDIASKGGNYLLNVGPTSEGLIPQQSLDRLAEVGGWMKVNGEAIYGSSASPFKDIHVLTSETDKDKKGRPVQTPVWDWRATAKPGKVFAMIFEWPTNGKFELPALKSKVTKAYLLADHTELKFTQTDAGISLDLPKEAPDKIASVVCLEIKE